MQLMLPQDLSMLIHEDALLQHCMYGSRPSCKQISNWLPCRWADGSQKGKNAGEKHERCRALTKEELATEEMQAGGWYNSVATPIVQAAGIDVFDAFPETVPLWSFHMWDKDCTHYCMPGPYELWTYLLTQKLRTTTFRD